MALHLAVSFVVGLLFGTIGYWYWFVTSDRSEGDPPISGTVHGRFSREIVARSEESTKREPLPPVQG